MSQGRIRLVSGLSTNCSYELGQDGDGTGRIEAFPALFTLIAEGDTATLILGDGSEREISVLDRVDPNAATFRFSDQRLA